MYINQLSHLRCRSLDAGRYADGQGLWLVKRSNERGKWVLRLSVWGTRREMGLGRFPDVGLAEARERAQVQRRVLRDGKDPIEERRAQRRARQVARAPLTVKAAVSGCFEARKAQLKGDGDAGRWLSPLTTHILPKIGSYPVEEIDQHVLREVLAPIWHQKPETAQKALNRLSITLQHAAALGLNVDLQAAMKARALLGAQRHVTKHIPSMPYADAPKFYRSLVKQEGVSARALRFLILTVCRTSEVRLAVLREIAGDVWTLPAERTKTGRSRRVPLVAEARAVLANCPTQGPLFPAYRGKPLSDMAMAKLMTARGLEARPHGFRATFRTWVEEQTDAPFEVKEACLGHAVDLGVVGAYQRSDRLEKRRTLLQSWERHLLTG
ncbi:DUF4102 domain-containing protein [Sphingomonas sp. MAH-20]|uniref:DUF4102 domain-containing protein n=1 Tax=Sphingomonas horti TaxID=2682842 RepID=A0A6I4J0F0_9SPHN|nr:MULTISPECIES: site-specific integrase [Sphingomonas]MBA2920672.1 integrase arm-type DNA-binding domain-containing protein [Sphingomonas sp. CGMCC 1.13658]MVO77608.1 DUF4102 domain-containing protein [Sphingomonas horti]